MFYTEGDKKESRFLVVFTLGLLDALGAIGTSHVATVADALFHAEFTGCAISSLKGELLVLIKYSRND